MKAVVWDGEALGAKFDEIEIPADLHDQADEYRTKLVEAAVELDDDAMAAYLDGNEPDEATLRRLVRKAVQRAPSIRCCAARPSRTRACSRCSTPSSTTCRRPLDRGAIEGIDFKTEEEIVRRPTDDEPFSHARLQDHGRPLRRHDHLLPRLFRQGRVRHRAAELDARTSASASAACC